MAYCKDLVLTSYRWTIAVIIYKILVRNGPFIIVNYNSIITLLTAVLYNINIKFLSRNICVCN